MFDMLVRLYDLPDPGPVLAAVAGVATLRRPAPSERVALIEWVDRCFSPRWAAECERAFAFDPPSCFVALDGRALVGFACYDCTRRNFFGPTGVEPAWRGRGLGAALTLACLAAMRDAGYAYAIIGGVGPADFYRHVCGATPIEGSTPGIYPAS